MLRMFPPSYTGSHQHVRALANSAFYLKLATVRFGDHSAEVEPEAVATGIALARWIDVIEGLG